MKIGSQSKMMRLSAEKRDLVKMIVNVFDKHQDPEITFLGRDKKGSQFFGVNKAIILAYCEDLEENHSKFACLYCEVVLLILLILNNHLLQFGCGLARYAEQVGESIHAKMKPVLLRHK